MNMIKKYTGRSLWLAGLMLTTLIAGCSGGGSSSDPIDPIVATDAPTVDETSPKNDAGNVLLNRKLTAIFSEEMDGDTIDTESFTVVGLNEDPLIGTVVYDAGFKTATFTPEGGLLSNDTSYTATITTAVTSIDGTALAKDHVWNFTTSITGETDDTPPTVLSNNAVPDFPLDRSVSATFSEELAPATVNGLTFTLANGTTPVEGVVSYSNMVATFNPTSNLLPLVTYTATLTTGIEDLADKALVGNTPAGDYVWDFKTGENTALKPVELGTAGDFVILAESTITNVPTSKITGDVGNAGTAFAIKLTCDEVEGTIYGNDDTYRLNGYEACFKGDSASNTYVANAVGDKNLAYTDAAGRTTPDFTDLHTGDISSQILAPGLYKWGTDVSIDNRGVTISGTADDVWIFQIAGKLTLATDAIVTLEGGARPENIFWQVAGESVEIGAGATLEGVVLAQTQINLTTGATVNGRLLAKTQVTLQQNTVTEPAL